MATQNPPLVDESGNIATDSTLFGNIDGQANTLGSLKDFVVSGSLDDKADKVANAVEGDFAALDAQGNLKDSGISKRIVPSDANANNLLASEFFVNSSIATNTATFRGTYNLVTDLGLTISATDEQVAAAIAAKLASHVPLIVPENNDYCFVQVPKTNDDPTLIERIDRYKCIVSEIGGIVTRVWEYEWSLNDSSFTAKQWEAINSGITSSLVEKLGSIEAGAEKNKIESIAKNGIPLTPDGNRAVNIEVPTATSTTPHMDASANVGVENNFARGDHTHPTDTTRAPLNSPALTGTPTAPNLSSDSADGQIANKKYVDDSTEPIRPQDSDVWWDRGVSDWTQLAGATGIYFKPSEFDMLENGSIFVLNIHTAQATSGSPLPVDKDAYIKITSEDGNTVYAVSDTRSLRYLNAWIPFTFTTVAPLSRDVQYVFSFFDASNNDTLEARLQLRADTTTQSPGLHINGHTAWRPRVTVRWIMGMTAIKSAIAGAVPTTRTINNKALTSDVTLTSDDINYEGAGLSGTLTGKIDDTNRALGGKLDSNAAAPDYDATATYAEGEHVTYLGKFYYAKQAITTAEAWTAAHWQETDMTTPDATLDITSQGSLRVVSAGGQTLWQQGYDLADTSSSTLGTDKVCKYDFAANATANVTLTLPTAAAGKVGDFILDVTNPALDSSAASYPSAFSDAATYAVGAEVVYDSKIWRCVTAVETAGAWTGATNWEEAWPYFSIAGLLSTVEMVVPEGENLSEILTFAPGTKCELYFTQTSFAVNSRPTWKVVRQDVEVVS